jgi:hypothetical protein
MQMANEGQKLIKYATVLWSEEKPWQIHFSDKPEACDMGFNNSQKTVPSWKWTNLDDVTVMSFALSNLKQNPV